VLCTYHTSTYLIYTAEHGSDDKIKQNVARLELHSQVRLPIALVQGSVTRQDTRDDSPLRTDHYPQDAKSMDDQVYYIEWQTSHLGKEFDRSGTEWRNSSSPTGTSAAAGQQSQLHSSEEETPMASTDVRFNVKLTASKSKHRWHDRRREKPHNKSKITYTEVSILHSGR